MFLVDSDLLNGCQVVRCHSLGISPQFCPSYPAVAHAGKPRITDTRLLATQKATQSTKRATIQTTQNLIKHKDPVVCKVGPKLLSENEPRPRQSVHLTAIGCDEAWQQIQGTFAIGADAQTHKLPQHGGESYGTGGESSAA